MKKYKFNQKLFLIISAQISLFLTGISLLLLDKLNLKSFGDLLFNSQLILLPLTLLYAYFENIGWRQPMFKWARKFLKFPPDIRGRWEGTLNRTTPDNYQSGIVFEIEQTMTKLHISTYTRNNNESVSILDDIACDIQHETNYKLCFVWEGVATNILGQEHNSGKFLGYTIVKIIEAEEARKLIGEYFTDRKPQQTQGKIYLEWQGLKLKRSY